MAEIQRTQMLANSRIRQDLAAAVTALGLMILTGVSVWRGTPWSDWYILVLLVGVPAFQAYLVHNVRKQEEPWLFPETERQRQKREKRQAKWDAASARAKARKAKEDERNSAALAKIARRAKQKARDEGRVAS